jgi:putative membrane-bound dehydrogenase-like protein
MMRPLLLLALLTPLWARSQGYSPDVALSRMVIPPDLQVELVASEPQVVQPVCIEFDDRGRLWVVQYIQYPNPSGLKRAVVDRWSRTTYDRIPEPPPRGPTGVDRITILSQWPTTNSHDFVNGLNLATGLAFGHGGVFVLNVPYLLFYPDRNQDDIPDGDPIVCLTGFGMEDAHSVANSLTWGPDGWLYGCQGSTVTARIRGVEFQQGVWRYHPLTHEFELFCEGGGNSWGLDFDENGELIYSTNFGPYRNLHGVQGAYYWKSFGKHGALHNPYAFGYFEHIPHTNFTGGHVTDGGIIYQGTNLPARFQGRYVCGDLLGHGVQWHEMYHRGSTFSSSHGGYLLEANDKWFAPTDVTMSPDGAIYVADWCDQRTAHPDPDADWDRSNGRIYRISAKGTKPSGVPDIRRLSTPELITLLGSKNDWLVRKARRLLADRRDPEAIFPLRSLVLETKNDHLALEALWALYVSGGFTENFAAKALEHRSAPVRKWAVRFLGDGKQISPSTARRLADLASSDPDVSVRAQLAASVQRLAARQALPIIETLLLRDIDSRDPYVPLLLWWAVERHAIHALPEVTSFFSSPAAWKSELVKDFNLERLVRRWIAEGTEQSYNAVARLLAEMTGDDPARQRMRSRLIAAIDQGFQDRPATPVTFGSGGLFARTELAEIQTNRRPARIEKVTPALAEQLNASWQEDTIDPALIRVNARTGSPVAAERARFLLKDSAAKLDLRSNMIRLLGELGEPTDGERLLALACDAPEPIQLASMDVLPAFDLPQLPSALLKHYASLSERTRARVRQLLLSRKPWAQTILQEVEAGHLVPADFSTEQLRVVALHQDKTLDDLVRKLWGKITPGSAEEKLAEMRRLNNDLNAGPGDLARGHDIFTKSCAVCHSLFGEGGKVGPDLTHSNRDREFLLGSMVDPSASIRKEYLAYELATKDGRILSGVIAEQSGANITLASSTGERIVVPQNQVVSLRESTVSLMPEDLVKPLKPQELRDLFSYLQTQKSPSTEK